MLFRSNDCEPGPALKANQVALHVSPNPATDMFYVDMPDGGYYDLSLIDINGKVVLAKQHVYGRVTVDVSGISKGIYVVMATANGETYKAKIAVE